MNDGSTCIYYNLFGGFAQLVIDGRRKANGGEGLLGAVFHFDEIFGTEEFLEALTAEVGDRKNAFGLEAGFVEDFFDVFGMIIVETVFTDVFVVGDFLVERIDFGTTSDVAGHLGKSALVGDFDDGDATGL